MLNNMPAKAAFIFMVLVVLRRFLGRIRYISSVKIGNYVRRCERPLSLWEFVTNSCDSGKATIECRSIIMIVMDIILAVGYLWFLYQQNFWRTLCFLLTFPMIRLMVGVAVKDFIIVRRLQPSIWNVVNLWKNVIQDVLWGLAYYGIIFYLNEFSF